MIEPELPSIGPFWIFARQPLDVQGLRPEMKDFELHFKRLDGRQDFQFLCACWFAPRPLFDCGHHGDCCQMPRSIEGRAITGHNPTCKNWINPSQLVVILQEGRRRHFCNACEVQLEDAYAADDHVDRFHPGTPRPVRGFWPSQRELVAMASGVRT